MHKIAFTPEIAVSDLVMHTNSYYELVAQNSQAASSYWHSVEHMYANLGYESAEFTFMSWLVDETLKRFNGEVEELLYAGQES